MRGQRALSASRDEEASLGAGANSRKAAVAPVRHGEKLRLAQHVVLSSIEFLGSSEYLEQWKPQSRSFHEVRLVNASALSRIKERIYSRVHARRKARAKAEVGQRREEEKNRHRPGGDGDPDAGD